jgi:heme/copper-type cytochrome/quinol oxidase subunit 2
VKNCSESHQTWHVTFCHARGSDSIYMKKNRLLSLLFLSFVAFSVLAIGCRSHSDGAAQHISVVMKKYAIEPEVIHVKAGETTELDVTTPDVQHGFDVPGLSIKEPVRPGQTTTITLKSPPKGEYKVVCGIICGPRHDDMVAKLIVE